MGGLSFSYGNSKKVPSRQVDLVEVSGLEEKVIYGQNLPRLQRNPYLVPL